jgi:proline iminopeptidase
MMMFPGGPGLAASYLRTAAELLADRFECYLVDPHGSGGSTAPDDDAGYDHLGHARFYEEVRATLGLEQVALLGHSFGGTVALTYAALFPSRSRCCISMDAAALGSELEGADAEAVEADMRRGLERHSGSSWYPEALRVWDDWTDLVLAAHSDHEVDEFFAVVAPLYFAHPDRPETRERIEQWTKKLTTNLAAAKVWESGLWQTIDLRPLLPKIQCPLLVIAGEDDLICGPAQAGMIARDVPAATLVIIPECGHNPEIEAPQELRRAILDWTESFG